MADFGTTFERLELKYLITQDTADLIRSVIAPYCVGDEYNGAGQGAGYTLYNLYLDSPGYEFYQARVRGDNDRIKLRVRTYGPEGPAFLEVKRKVVDVISKIRVAVDREQIADAASGFAAPLFPSARNEAHLQQFAYWRSLTGAEPQVLVRYQREAYVSIVDRYARVTFDRRMCAQRADGWNLLGNPAENWFDIDQSWRYDHLRSPIVLELKCETRMPVWMSNLIQSFELLHRGFSKYCFGVESVLLEEHTVDTRSLSQAAYV